MLDAGRQARCRPRRRASSLRRTRSAPAVTAVATASRAASTRSAKPDGDGGGDVAVDRPVGGVDDLERPRRSGERLAEPGGHHDGGVDVVAVDGGARRLRRRRRRRTRCHRLGRRGARRRTRVDTSDRSSSTTPMVASMPPPRNARLPITARISGPSTPWMSSDRSRKRRRRSSRPMSRAASRRWRLGASVAQGLAGEVQEHVLEVRLVDVDGPERHARVDGGQHRPAPARRRRRWRAARSTTPSWSPRARRSVCAAPGRRTRRGRRWR